MSLLTENIIPGNQGKVFGTNAKESLDLERIKNRLLQQEGIKEVRINAEVFPREFTVFTSKLINIIDIEEIVKKKGFHAIPKDTF